jgi:hypothetical protein
VPDAAVAMDALNCISSRAASVNDVMHKITMAPQAILLHIGSAARLHLDRLVKILKRKSLGVAISVLGLGDVLWDKIVRQMALNARRHRLVRALRPRVV